jgi:putative hydrolase of the HAD superfamily
MVPILSGAEPVLAPLGGLRAVLFDLYGTLFISGSGEVGTVAAPCDEAMDAALRAVGLPPAGPLDGAVETLFATIREFHARDRARGIDYPEMQVAEVWRAVLGRLAAEGVVEADGVEAVDRQRLAVEYEARANPCWPMPGLDACLAALDAKGFLRGIVSNAQFYTPALFPALLGRSAEQCGFDPQLQFYSYRYGRAKPGTALFEAASAALGRRGIQPDEVLYLGNDMLNDVLPARRVGFRAALFAGDARSLRWRHGEPELGGVAPELVLTSLAQLDRCTMIG